MSAARSLLFAPGAGAPSSSPWMQAWRQRLEQFGRVTSFDYPYQLAGRRSPDRFSVLLESHQQAFECARSDAEGPVVLAGKSMGGRIGCHVAAGSEEPPAALVCLGYPLVGQRGELRDAVLLALKTPVLFVQGTHDALCPLERLREVLAKLSAPHELFVVEGADHSLKVKKGELKARSETQEQVDERTARAIGKFLDGFA